MAYSSANDRYSKLQIEVDVNDESLKIFGGDLISVQSQLRLLRRELTVATDPKEILILNNAVNQLQQQLLLTRERSRDLFGSLSLLPGPLGRFAFEAERAFRFIQLITTTPLANWGNQFKAITGGLTGSNFANVQRLPGEENNVSNNGAAAANIIAAGANLKTAESVDKVTEAYIKEGVAVKKVTDGLLINVGANSAEVIALKKYAQYDQELKVLVQEYNNLTNVSSAYRASKEAEIIAVTNLRNAAMAEAESAMAVTGALIEQKAATTLLTVADETLTKANTFLTNSFKNLIALFGTLAGVGIIAAVTAAWVAYKNQVDKVTISNENLNRGIENNKELLALDEASLKRRTEMRNAVLKAGNASDRDLQKEAFNDATEAARELDNALLFASKNQQKALDNVKRSDNGLLAIFGIGSANEKELKDNLEKADKQVNDLQEKSKDAVAKQIVEKNKFAEIKRKEEYNDALRNLDAQIALEIEKYNTSDKLLKDYYKRRNDLVDDFNVNIHLSQAERDEREKQQKKIINDALIDDTVKFLKNDKAVIDKSLEDEAKDTEHYFDLKILQANKEAEIEKAQAGKDAHSKSAVILEAETKLSKELDDIYIARLNSQLKLLKETQQGLTEYTDEYYQNELNIINKNEQIELDTYEGNEKMQIAIKEKYAKERLNLESKQLMDIASLQKKLAENIEGDLSGDKNTFKNIDKKYKLLQEALNNEYQARIKNAKKTNGDIAAIEAQYNKESQDLNVKKLEEKQVYEKKIVDLSQRTGEFLVGIGEAEMAANQGKNRAKFNDAKKYAVAGIWLEKAAALGSIYMNTSKAVAADVAASPLTFGEPWATIDTIIGIAQGAAVITAGAVAASSINGTDFQPTNTNTGMGKNYGQGGMIDGPSHNQGGVSINAEGGEAVMTRGAVTAFAPLLSLLNQAGGGTSFGNMVNQAKFDNPRTQGGITEPQILKTYVVESDLTNAQQRVARLKDLSTL